MDFVSNKLVEFVSRTTIFVGMKEHLVEKILRLATHTSFRAQTPIFQAGSNADYMFILLGGSVSILAHGSVLATLRPLAVVGEIGILLGEKRNASAFAEETCQALVISRNDIEKLIQEDLLLGKTILNNLIRVLSDKLSNSNKSIMELVGRNNELSHKVDTLREEVNKQIAEADLEELEAEEEELSEEKTEHIQREFFRYNLTKEDDAYILVDNIKDYCQIKNISLGGLAASFPDLSVTLTSSECITGKIMFFDQEPIEIVALVKWVSSEDFGAEFTKISPQSRSQLKIFLEEKVKNE